MMRKEAENNMYLFLIGLIGFFIAFRLGQFAYQIVLFENIVVEIAASAVGSLVVMIIERDFS